MNILEDLLAGLRDVCAAFPDKRSGGRVVYTMADIGLSAFSLFFMQRESFLSDRVSSRPDLSLAQLREGE